MCWRLPGPGIELQQKGGLADQIDCKPEEEEEAWDPGGQDDDEWRESLVTVVYSTEKTAGI